MPNKLQQYKKNEIELRIIKYNEKKISIAKQLSINFLDAF